MKDQDYIQANETLDALHDPKPNKIKKRTTKDKLKNIYKKANPLKNTAKLGDGVHIKWKVKPYIRKEKFKMKLEITKDFGDVELYAKVDGKIFKVMENEIGYDPNAKDVFSAEASASLKF